MQAGNGRSQMGNDVFRRLKKERRMKKHLVAMQLLHANRSGWFA